MTTSPITPRLRPTLLTLAAAAFLALPVLVAAPHLPSWTLALAATTALLMLARSALSPEIAAWQRRFAEPADGRPRTDDIHRLIAASDPKVRSAGVTLAIEHLAEHTTSAHARARLAASCAAPAPSGS